MKEDENHENPTKRLNFSDTEEPEEYEGFYRRGQRELHEVEEQGCYIRLRSQSKGGKVHWDTESKSPGQYPIVATGGGDRRYKPFNVGNVTGLVQMLPPITEGGAAWLRQLDKVTSGTQLALGNFRAIAGRCITITSLEEVQVIARVVDHPDATPYCCVQERVGNAIRQMYPNPNAAAIIKLDWKPDQNSRDYIEKSKEKWLQQTGHNPTTRGLHQE